MSDNETSLDKSDTETVLLEVGGIKYICPVSAIQKHPNSVLARCLQDSQPSGEKITIDRDGTLFAPILHYLLNDKLDFKSYTQNYISMKLLYEADYYGLVELMDLCREYCKPQINRQADVEEYLLASETFTVLMKDDIQAAEAERLYQICSMRKIPICYVRSSHSLQMLKRSFSWFLAGLYDPSKKTIVGDYAYEHGSRQPEPNYTKFLLQLMEKMNRL